MQNPYAAFCMRAKDELDANAVQLFDVSARESERARARQRKGERQGKTVSENAQTESPNATSPYKQTRL